MRLATITNWAYGTTVALTVASGTTMLLSSGAQERERAAVSQRYELDHASSQISDEVMALSSHAREYVMSGDSSDMDVYRREFAALGSQEERLRHAKDIGAGGDELGALADAIKWADSLHDEQAQATAAREKGDEDGARRIIFGAAYNREFDRVESDVERFQYRLDQRTGTEVASAAKVAKFWKRVSEFVLASTGLLFLCVLYFVFKRRVLRPVIRLSDVVSRLAAQDYAVEAPSYDEIDEIGDMAQAIRVFRENGIQRQRLERELNADRSIRSLLSRMTQRMQECEAMHHLERVIESFVPQIVPGAAGRLYLLDEGRGLIESCSWSGAVHSRSHFPPSACWALQRGELHRPRGGNTDVLCDHVHPDGEAFDSFCLPLIAQRTTLGLLYFESRGEASGEGVPVPEVYLEILAENVGLAVGNLRLRDELRAMAMVDPLTGLANRRHLDAVMNVWLSEPGRVAQSISCVMIDVDYFKRFNDKFGHDAGDAVLRAVGAQLKHLSRGDDVACRYGGEEFLLLLAAMPADLAARRAEEVRELISGLRVQHEGQELGEITASLGVATAPDECAIEVLIQTADAALLRAKESGRNRVVVATPRQRRIQYGTRAAG
jgi:diguanylate cyclase (GGDEF)-like protein